MHSIDDDPLYDQENDPESDRPAPLDPEDAARLAEVGGLIFALRDRYFDEGYEAAVHEREITSVVDVFELGRQVGAKCGPGVRVERDEDAWDAYVTGLMDGSKPCNLRHRRSRRVYGQRPPARPGVRSSAR